MLNKKLVLGGLAGATLLLGAVVMTPATAEAAGMMSGVCSDCHTMHNSQGGVAVDLGGPNNQLLAFDGCIGCHAREDNGASGKGATAPAAPQVGTQVGIGSMNGGGYFGDSSDAFQHNITGLSASAGGLGGSLVTSPGGSFDGSAGFDCESCHGDAAGAHHTYASSSTARTGATGSSYRMLNVGTVYVSGTGSDQYGNVAGTTSNSYDAASMNLLCAECHGGFHDNGAAGGVLRNAADDAWIRHPTDVTATTYGTAIANEVPRGDGNEVMCISCHAAHGTDAADLLRFSYNANSAGDASVGTGCETCHNAK